MSRSLARRVAAEAVGSALLLAAVVGSGIMGQRLAGGNDGLTLLCNSLATGAALVAIILALGPISAQLNPAITVAEAARGALPWSTVPALLAAQIAGGFAGVAAAEVMFDAPLFVWSEHARADGGMLLAEGLATFGLVLVVQRTAARGVATVAAAVGCYIAAAYWFTSSTSFANPAVTLARAATDTFTGIRPIDVPGFLVAQAAGAAAAALLGAWLGPAGAAAQETLVTLTVLFACVHNAGRSQMAAAFFNQLADPERAEALSAGTQPGPHVHPVVAEAMQEVGIDLSGARPRLLDDQLQRRVDFLVTMGCGEACPYIPGARRIDWPLPDPKGQPIETVRTIRDQIRDQVAVLIDERGWR